MSVTVTPPDCIAFIFEKKTFQGSINGIIIITLISPRGRPPTHFENNNGGRGKKKV